MNSIHCIDVGNTMTKIATFSSNKLVKSKSIITSKFIEDTYSHIFEMEEIPFSCCSVVPKATERMLSALEKKKCSYYLLNHKSIGNFPLAYPFPSEIGADRLANAIAVHSFYETPAIVIDMGTATTFDVVSKSGGYEGGVITPGAQGFLDFLHEKTALLPNLKLKNYENFSNSLPRSTEHAMQFGARVGYSQMVLGILNTLSSQTEILFGEKPKVLLTGGSSLLSEIPEAIHQPNLTLLGLAKAYELHPPRI